MKKIMTIFSLSLLLLAGIAESRATAAGLPLDAVPLKRMEGGYYYLGCNLHADVSFNKISSVNYQMQGALLPWGTEVRIIRVLRNYMVFEDVAKNRTYSYEFHRKTRRSVPLVEHLGRIFLKDPDELKQRVEAMSEIDKDGIYEGRVKPGMSREGVLIAIGYPPEFANQEALMTDRDWFYWVSRHSKMMVSFGRDGLVSRVSGDY